MKRSCTWVKKAFLSLVGSDDSTPYPVDQHTYNGVSVDAYRFSPYGLSAKPPAGSGSIILSADGREDDPIALVDDPRKRFKELRPGEVQVGNYETKANVKFDQLGNVIITTGENGTMTINVGSGGYDINVTGAPVTLDSDTSVQLTAPTVAITGDVTVSGSIVAQGDVVGAGKSLSTHTHTISSGSSAGVTTPPN